MKQKIRYTVLGALVGFILGAVVMSAATPAAAQPHVRLAASTSPAYYNYADSMYCQALSAWNRAAIPGVESLLFVARTALRANGEYKATGTALVTAVVGGQSIVSEGLAALRACHIVVRMHPGR